MTCVEGWSSRATWGGFIYNDLAALVRPKPAATHVRFDCMDDYWESVAITELQRDGALFTTHMNGTYLPAKYGAVPLRMILPWLYGYKGAKVISRLTFSNKEEKSFWPARGPFTTAGDIELRSGLPARFGAWRGTLDHWRRGDGGLDDHPAAQRRCGRPARPPGSAAERCARGAEVGQVQRRVGRDDAHQRHQRQVQPLGDHLRADQHVGLWATKRSRIASWAPLRR